MAEQTWDIAVIGAGVIGAWTAWYLRQAGQRVVLQQYCDARLMVYGRRSIQRGI
jgi:glycerol-3-phosphate dehydrogenase